MTHVTYSDLFLLYYSTFLMLFQPTKLILYPLSDNLHFEKHYYYLYFPIILSLKSYFILFTLYSKKKKVPQSFPGTTLNPEYFSHSEEKNQVDQTFLVLKDINTKQRQR